MNHFTWVGSFHGVRSSSPLPTKHWGMKTNDINCSLASKPSWPVTTAEGKGWSNGDSYVMWLTLADNLVKARDTCECLHDDEKTTSYRAGAKPLLTYR